MTASHPHAPGDGTTNGFYQPDGGWVGDVIPAEIDGTVWLFYLYEDRAPRTAEQVHGMPWAAVTTTDFAHFDDQGIVLMPGGRGDADFDCYTGSVVTDDEGVLHLFYTGHNPDRRTDRGDLQVVCHATSSGSPSEWVKHPEWTFGAGSGYAPEDWRDPFVFRPSVDGPWRMALAARAESAPYRRSGEVACLESDDLIVWRPAVPIWQPHRFITQECPDVFRWGERWYLVYSEFSDSFQTRYRIADSSAGPWRAPAQDTFDGRAFYAPKTVEHGDDRYLIGWIASRHGDADDGAWQWAGTLAALQLHQRSDGSLGVRLPDAVIRRYASGEALTIDVLSALEPLNGASPRIGAGARTRHSAWMGSRIPDACLITAEIDIAPLTQSCGLLLRSSDDGEEGYALRLEPQRDRMVFDRWPRSTTGGEQWQVGGDVPHAVELERPVPLAPGRHRVVVHLNRDLCVVVVDEHVALSTRLYDHAQGRVGFFVTDGEARVDRFDVASLTGVREHP